MTVPVTDHALIRYLERVMGVDVEAARLAIAVKVAIAADHPGASAVLSDGWRYQLREGRVVTVVRQRAGTCHDDPRHPRRPPEPR